MNFSLIVAADEKLGIGKNGDLPWKICGELAYFKKITTEVSDPSRKNAVVMGKNTWFSIPEKFRPLPSRLNCVLSSSYLDLEGGALHFFDFESCLDFLSKTKKSEIENVFVIGGAKLYSYVISKKQCQKIYFTKVFGDYYCDTFFPKIPSDFSLENHSEIKEDCGAKYQFQVFKKI